MSVTLERIFDFGDVVDAEEGGRDELAELAEDVDHSGDLAEVVEGGRDVEGSGVEVVVNCIDAVVQMVA